MSGETAIVERLGRVFTETLQIEAPSADADLLESGILDSFQLVTLLAGLEQHFGLHIRIEDIELDDLRSISRIARLVATVSP
ncbi:MAG: acyl carrier protein [Burkholderiales bacterium]